MKENFLIRKELMQAQYHEPLPIPSLNTPLSFFEDALGLNSHMVFVP